MTELVRRERRRERARRVIRSSSTSLRMLAKGIGMNETNVRHFATDRVEQSPFYRDMEGLWLLAKGRRTDPTPELIELEVLAMEAFLDSRSTDELLRMLAAEMDCEHDYEAAENRASQKRDVHEMIEAHKREARTSIRIAAILEVLLARGVNPFKADA